MKKKIWLTLLSIVIIGAVFAVIVAKQKPNDADFVRWMENAYGIECLDYNCTAFKLEISKEGKEPIVMQSVHGSYSPGIFAMEVQRKYRNFEDASYQLDIKLKGFLGAFTIEEETIRNIPKLTPNTKQ